MTKDITIAVEEGRACECCKSFFVDKKGKYYQHDYIATCKNCWSELTPEEKRIRYKANPETV